MENSKLYSNQDIERLKRNIESYKETLTSLKMGTPLEDYLNMKKEFDGLKTQIAHLEGITEILDDKQNSQIKGYEKQIKLLSMQIDSLNQTIGEMNQDIITILNKLLIDKDNEASTTSPIPNITLRQPKITQTTDHSAITSEQPSYKMLLSLAGKATNTQLDVNNGVPSSHKEDQRNQSEERHFNQQYFQSINTHPSQIYNGLYRNTTTESTFYFKNATNLQEIPISVYESNILPHAEIHKSTDNELNVKDIVNFEETAKINNTVTIDAMSSVISNEPDIPETSKVTNEQVDINKSPSLKNAEIEVFETKIEEDESIIQIEKVNKQLELNTETTEEEHKKEKNALLFNFFRKWS